MPYNLKNRHLLTLLDYSAKEIMFLIELAATLKKAKYAGTERERLTNKNIALIFEKASTRTRCAFEVAAYDQGAKVTYLGPTGSQMGLKESIKDTARVLGRMYDAIEYRGFGQDVVQQLAQYSGVPVFNGLTDRYHPTQVLADLLTVKEHIDKPLKDVTLAYVGDGRNNMGNSLMVGSAKMGIDFRIIAPKEVQPQQELINKCKDIALNTGAKITITPDLHGVKDADAIYTDVWVSMGEPPEVWQNRINLLKPYQVNKELMKMTGKGETIFLHCLPAFHNTETKIGKDINEKFDLPEMEVTEEVFESANSVVFDQAENRMHTIKALLVAVLGH